MSLSNNFPTIKPTLLLDFANTKQLDPRITFTRASTATYYGTQTAKAEENLLLQSQTFQTSWGNGGTTETPNTTVAPDGTTTADTLTANAGTGFRVLEQSNISVFSGGVYTYSVFVQAGTNNFVQLYLFNTGFATNQAFANFNVTVGAGAVGTVGTSATATITDVGNGWYRCTIISTADATTTSSGVGIGLISSSTSARRESWTTAGTETVILWGAQLEQRSAATAYTATTTAAITNYIPAMQTAASGVARFDNNPTTDESLGLLIEESRTNLLTYSAALDTWTVTRATVSANSNVAPDGTLSADRLVEDTTASASHLISASPGTLGAGTYTFSVYAKAYGRSQFRIAQTQTTSYSLDFDLTALTTSGAVGGAIGTITAVGNDWYRCTMTFTTVASIAQTFVLYLMSGGSPTYTGDGWSGMFFWGAQAEAGAFATSYIPTVASQVTRSADAASMTGTNFSSWYRADEGTFYAEFAPASSNFGSNKNIFLASDGTVNNYNGLRYTSSGSQPANSATVASILQSNILSGTMVAGTWYKMSGAYKVNDFAMSRDAGTVGTDTSGTLPVVTQAEIGALAGTNISSQMIKKLAYYPARLSNAQLQALTS